MSFEGVERRLAAIMFTDIVGYTELMARDEEAARRARDRHEAVVRPTVERYHGTWVERTGDETVSAFPSALDAVNCALAVQVALEKDAELQLRVGIHQGDVTFDAAGISGDGVNVAARVRPMAKPGGICVTGDVHQSVRGRPGLAFESLGEQDFKNVDHPVPVFAVSGAVEPPRLVPAAAPASRPETRRLAVWGATALCVTAIAAGWWLYRPIVELAPIRAIAVLPLENLSGDPEEEYFADGMTEALIGDLAKIGALRVNSRTSVMRFKNSDKTLLEIARALNVEGIVEGTVMRVGDRVRITVQLIDARHDQHLWAERYDRDLRDVLVLQSEIARSVAHEIRIALTPEEGTQLRSAKAVDPQAHEAYLRGRYFWDKRSGEGLRRAVEYFNSAIEKDPDYAAAHAGLADSYALLSGYGVMPATEAMPRAEAAARRALEIDESLAEAHISLAFVRAFYHWDWPGAMQSCRRAIQLDPNFPMAHHWYGLVLVSSGRAREGLAELERAHELDPLSVVISRNLGSNLVATDPRRAVELLLHTLELNPEIPLAHRSLALAYHEQGEDEKALAIAEEQLNDLEAAYVYARAGRRVEALHRLERGEQPSAPLGGLTATSRAQVYGALRDDERTFEWLERAYAAREGALGMVLKGEPSFVRLYQDPRFVDLLRRMNYPES